jgi:sensor histidine kinase YesM
MMFQSMNTLQSLLALFILVLAITDFSVSAFSPSRFGSRRSITAAFTSSTRLNDSQVETLEFKIYPDGRVEEIVRGIKGSNCHKVTEGINEMLGKVVATAPTEEMYEQEVVIEQTVTETVGESSGTGDASWEGKSSW